MSHDHVRIAVSGPGSAAAVESLWAWLPQEPGLRGRVRLSRVPLPGSAMGAALEFLIATSATGVLTVLARSLSLWIGQQRTEVTIEVNSPDGRQVSLTATKITPADAESLLRHALTLEPAESTLTEPSPES
ncbi:effector-associated constant component EACC1 [Nonomuraea rubra]